MSYITGPTHNLLGLEFCADSPDRVEIIPQPPVGQCDHGHIDEAQLLEAVQDGLKQTDWNSVDKKHLKAVSYVKNDSPRYEIYEHCAKLISQQLATGGEFKKC